MIAKLLWEIGASLQIVVAIAHILGTLFSKLLHPTDKNRQRNFISLSKTE